MLTSNLDSQQYRIAQKNVFVDGNLFHVSAAVPTEPFDQALDRFRLTERRFLPLLVVLASLLGYWLSGRALAPVNRIIQSAEQIGPQNLSQRLEVPKAADELTPFRPSALTTFGVFYFGKILVKTGMTVEL
ncbi:MAG: HAMP domain-containing protein [Candidatus Acidiferrum sp.]